MRERKCRAWVPSKNCYAKVTKLEFSRYDGRLQYAHVEMDDGSLMLYHVGEMSGHPDIPYAIIEDFTGRKDKDGRDIYDGDLVIVEKDKNQKAVNTPYFEGANFGDVLTVEWNETNMRWSMMPKDDNLDQVDMDYYCAWSGWNWLKVIGNRHQHPELAGKGEAV